MLDDLLDVLAERPRTIHENLDRWWLRAAPDARLVQGTDRWVELGSGAHTPPTVHLDVADTSDGPVLPEELARPWLRQIHRLQRPNKGLANRRVPWAKPALAFLDLNPPRYWQAPKPLQGEWAYIDLVAAYQSIYSKLTLDVLFRPDPDRPRLGLGRLDWLGYDELGPIKPTQLAVGGIIRATKMCVYERGTPQIYSTIGWSPFLAPDLWGVIATTLHAIASEAISRFGAVLWYIDGGVVPVDQAQPLSERIRALYGLEATVRHQGPGTIWGPGSYHIADQATQSTHRLRKKAHYVIDPPPAVTALISKTLTTR